MTDSIGERNGDEAWNRQYPEDSTPCTAEY